MNLGFIGTGKIAASVITGICSAACCTNVPKNKNKPIQKSSLKNSVLLLFICLVIFEFSKISAIGIIDKKPIKNLAPLNVRGPILSIPVS